MNRVVTFSILLIALAVAAVAGVFLFEWWRARQPDEPATIEVATVPVEAQGKTADAPWIPAFTHAAKTGEASMRITKATIGLLPHRSMTGDEIAGDKPLLAIHVRIENHSANKVIEYRGSLTKPPATLTDEFGNRYEPRGSVLLFAEGQRGQDSVYPGKHADDVYVFAPPIDKAKTLRLELNAERVGAKGAIRFELPVGKVERVSPMIVE